jgi:phosphohistidine swiveling domain-containing protein
MGDYLTQKETAEKVASIKKRRWYRQSSAAIPYFGWAPVNQVYRLLGNDSFAIYFKHDFHYGYFDRDLELDFCKKVLAEQRKDKSYIDKIIDQWKKLASEQDKYFNNIQFMHNLSDKEFLELHKHHFEILSKMWNLAIRIEFFDPYGHDLLEQENNGFFSDKQLKILTANVKLSYLQEELIELMQIAVKNYGKKPDILSAGDAEKSPIASEIKKHAQKYYYIHGDWASVKEVEASHFFGSIKEIMQKELAEINKDINELLKYPDKIQREKEEILKKKPLKELLNTIYFFQEVTEWRDVRKKYAQLGNYFGERLLDELQRRTDVDRRLLRFAIPPEIEEYGLNIPGQYIELLHERSQECLFVESKKMVSVSKSSIAEMKAIMDSTIADISEGIKGNVGNPGCVTARASVINSIKDFHKFKKGDIIVAPMTRPEYMLLIGKASGIITDEGGVTCHAAIVSRERGIPCIIGTQIATDVIKDGDMIELDANKGIVRKLK